MQHAASLRWYAHTHTHSRRPWHTTNIRCAEGRCLYLAPKVFDPHICKHRSGSKFLPTRGRNIFDSSWSSLRGSKSLLLQHSRNSYERLLREGPPNWTYSEGASPILDTVHISNVTHYRSVFGSGSQSDAVLLSFIAWFCVSHTYNMTNGPSENSYIRYDGIDGIPFIFEYASEIATKQSLLMLHPSPSTQC